MARSKPILIRGVLHKLFSTAFLMELATSTGAVRRVRHLDIVAFFWTLVFGFALGRERTIAGLRRAYEKTTGHTIEESSFYNRFNDGLVAMLKSAVAHAFDTSVGLGRALQGPLASFKDVLLTDSTVVRLHEMLAKTFPACRTNHTKAALKGLSKNNYVIFVYNVGHFWSNLATCSECADVIVRRFIAVNVGRPLTLLRDFVL